MEPIAVVGFSMRLPGDIHDESSLWEALQQRKNTMTGFPPSRIAVEDDGAFPTKGAHFLTGDIGAFDASFFSLTAAEAASLDPQHRWALESVFHALENAGIAMESLSGSNTAVFAATSSTDYMSYATMDGQSLPRPLLTGGYSVMLPNRISWYYNFQGPSVLVDTACSGGMVALDMACQSINCGDTSTAVIIGSNVMLKPDFFMMAGAMGFLSPDGRSYSFDSRANGYGRAEGLVALLVKPLSAAIANGDNIRALVRSTGSNQDGRTPGITTPSARAQETLVRRVYQKAALDLHSTRYLEAHGTGTPIGDPIEMEAIASVFGPHRSPEDPLYVTSVKANVGHLEASAGLAGLVKTILLLERGLIPPAALFEQVNPAVDLLSGRIKIPTEEVSWPCQGLRRASVNSFGIGGTNSHAVLDDACYYLHKNGLKGNHVCTVHEEIVNVVNGQWNGVSNGSHNELVDVIRADLPKGSDFQELAEAALEMPKLLIWSASNEKGLQRVTGGYSEVYESIVRGSAEQLDHLAHTLAARRSNLSWRRFAIVESALHVPGGEKAPFSDPVRATSATGLGFIFTGQGASYLDMGMGLLQYPVFKHTLSEIDVIFSKLGCAWSLFEEISNEHHINLPEYSQPICTALQIALIDLLESLGVGPLSVIGHSSGEIAAAYAVGALSKDSAAKVAFFRGLLAGKLKREMISNPGAMMAIDVPAREVPEILEKIPGTSGVHGSLSVACINSPVNCTVSGPEEAIDALGGHFGRMARKLTTGVAYHSSAMDRIAAEYLERMGTLKSRDVTSGNGSVMFSTVSGKRANTARLSEAQYWVDNLVSPVMFSEGLVNMLQEVSEKSFQDNSSPITDLIEVGPHSALQVPVADTISQSGLWSKPRYHSVLRRKEPALRSLLSLVGTLFCHGHPVSVSASNRRANDNRPPIKGCPAYPFDHSSTYWTESRLARAQRLNKHADYGILGRPFFDWNPLQPRWRNFLTSDDFPWLADHAVEGIVTFPGAGSLVVAIKALAQHVLPNDLVTGFLINEAVFMSPVIVNEERSKTEIMVQLLPLPESSGELSSRYRVRIHSHHNDEWTECMDAYLQVEYEQCGTEVDGGSEQSQSLRDLIDAHNRLVGTCTKPMRHEALYEYASRTGIEYGPAFQVVRDIALNGASGSTGTIGIVPHCVYTTEDLFHTTCIDAALQVSMAVAVTESPETMAMWIPNRVSNAWFSAKPWRASSLSVSSNDATVSSLNTAHRTLRIVSDDGEPLCQFDDLVFAKTALPGQEAKQLLPLHGLRWRPQLSLMQNDQLFRALNVVTDPSGSKERREVHRLYSAAFHLALRRELIYSTPSANLPWHFEKLIAAALPHLTDETIDTGDYQEEDLETILQTCERLCPGFKLASKVVRNLGPIFKGTVDPLQVMFEDDSMGSFYDNSLSERIIVATQKYFELASHESSGLRIIEVGAGVGTMTEVVLSTLRNLEERDGSNKFHSYTFTDISPSFFEKARARFQAFDDRMTYKVLDLEQDVDSQGFVGGSYDIVIAFNVIHATSELAATLKRVRSLISPGGYFMNAECVKPQVFWTNMMWGLLPGWWLSKEEHRVTSPLITVKQWDTLLKETGFHGIDVAVPDFDNDAHLCDLMVSTASTSAVAAAEVSAQEPRKPPQLVIVIDSHVQEQSNLAEQLLSTTKGIIVPLATAHEATWATEDLVISLVDVCRSFLSTTSEDEFRWLQQFVQRSQRLLWASTAGCRSSGGPQGYVAQGFLRSLRFEMPDSHMVWLVIHGDDAADRVSAFGPYIQRVAQAEFSSGRRRDVEYAVQDDHLTTGRLVREITLREEIEESMSLAARNEQFLTGSPLKMDVGSPGDLETLRLIDDTSFYAGELSAEEIEIESRVWPVNFRDVLCALNKIEAPEGVGFECAGVVTRTGSACGTEFHPGDRVAYFGLGTMRTYSRGHMKNFFKIPDGLSFEEVASIFSPAVTAICCLINSARLKKGEKILIHSASGSVGQLSIQIAKMLGAEVYVTVGFDDKKQLLMDKFGIPADHIFYSRNASFAKGIMRATAGRGVDVVLNSLAGDLLQASWECISPFGRFIEMGKKDILNNSKLPMKFFEKNTSFHCVDLIHLLQSDASSVQGLMSTMLDLLSRGFIKPPEPTIVHHLADAKSAFRRVQSGRHPGRVLLTAEKPEQVMSLDNPYTRRFNPNASYVIAGGLGGVGRSVATWMVSMGARNLILLSRSGSTSSQAAAQLVDNLRSRGVNIATPVCDVSNATELSNALEDCGKAMPPVKGCINAAMVLHNVSLDQMTQAEWDSTIRSKVASSWNLHEVLPDDLDFFILFSSVVGLCGSPAQSNYAAGCTYQDALARYRTSLGQKATSLNLGWMESVGAVSESSTYQRIMTSFNVSTAISEEELMAVLRAYCLSSRPPSAELPTVQLAMGVNTGGYFLARGQRPSPLVSSPMFSGFMEVFGGKRATKETQAPDHIVIQLQKAESVGQRRDLVVRGLVEKLARLLSVSPADIDQGRSISTYGVDSLVAVELRNWINQDLHATIAVFDLLSNLPITGLANLIIKKTTLFQTEE